MLRSVDIIRNIVAQSSLKRARYRRELSTLEARLLSRLPVCDGEPCGGKKENCNVLGLVRCSLLDKPICQSSNCNSCEPTPLRANCRGAICLVCRPLIEERSIQTRVTQKSCQGVPPIGTTCFLLK